MSVPAITSDSFLRSMLLLSVFLRLPAVPLILSGTVGLLPDRSFRIRCFLRYMGSLPLLFGQSSLLLLRLVRSVRIFPVYFLRSHMLSLRYMLHVHLVRMHFRLLFLFDDLSAFSEDELLSSIHNFVRSCVFWI